MNRFGRVTAYLLVAVLLMLGGCDSSQLLDDLSQRQAQEVLASLAEQGIHADLEKKTGGGARYTVYVKEADFQRANQFLVAEGLPKKERIAFDDLIDAGGILPQSREMEALKADYALSLQIEDMLKAVPGVAEAKAVVRHHYTHLVEGKTAPASVTVVVTKREKKEVEQELLLSIVEREVPGIARDHLLLQVVSGKDRAGVRDQQELVPVSNFLWGVVRVATDDSLTLTLIGIFSLLLVAGSFTVFGYWVGVHQILKNSGSELLSAGQEREAPSAPTTKSMKSSRRLTEVER